MRREDREITDFAAIEAILKRGTACQLALCDGDMPYVVTLNYGYEDRCIYLHGALEGKKLDILRRNPNVCLTVVGEATLDLQENGVSSTTYYESVVGFGRGEMLTDAGEKRHGLGVLMAHLGMPIDVAVLPDTAVAKTAVVRVRLTEITGKRHPHPEQATAGNG